MPYTGAGKRARQTTTMNIARPFESPLVLFQLEHPESIEASVLLAVQRSQDGKGATGVPPGTALVSLSDMSAGGK